MHTRRNRIGESLLGAGLITSEQLEEALKVQDRTRERLGDIFVKRKVVARLDLYRVLAKASGVSLIDLTLANAIDPWALGLDPRELAALGWAPFDVGSSRIAVASSHLVDGSERQSIEERIGAPVEVFMTTEWDLVQYLARAAGSGLSDLASFEFANRYPDLSAAEVTTPRQRLVLIVCALVTAAALVTSFWNTLALLVMLVSLVFLAGILFKVSAAAAGARVHFDTFAPAILDDADLPRYSVLVPLYHEAIVVEELIASLEAIDYPPEKLEILLLVEEDDVETRTAIVRARPPATMVIIGVPPGGPATKPKACNVGLVFATGDLLVIYDAEDRPEPDQLRKVAALFNVSEQEVICVQAALNYHNRSRNLLTRMFTLEYSLWFDYMLEGLDFLHLPIPLGGTSNHFRTGKLRELGGWDPFNVTEDADLGIRAAALGYRVKVIGSTTFEEANSKLGSFVKQRSRWIKGYMQTAFVHTRHPVRLARKVGILRFLAFLLLVAATPLAFLAVIPLYAIFIVSIFTPSILGLPHWAIVVGDVDFFAGNTAMIYLSMVAGYRRGHFDLSWLAVLNPIYWLAHSVASYRALWQLIARPHYWDKTPHGIA